MANESFYNEENSMFRSRKLENLFQNSINFIFFVKSGKVNNFVSSILLLWRSRAHSGYLEKFAENPKTGPPTMQIPKDKTPPKMFRQFCSFGDPGLTQGTYRNLRTFPGVATSWVKEPRSDLSFLWFKLLQLFFVFCFFSTRVPLLPVGGLSVM